MDNIKNLNKLKEKRIKIIRKIGNGGFGEVFEAELKQSKPYLQVTVKQLKQDANESEKLDSLKEAIALNTFDHVNLIKFYGVCCQVYSLNKLEIKLIVSEFINSGDLLSYLRKYRERKEGLE